MLFAREVWDSLAEVWDLFECQGTTASDLIPLTDLIQPPILVVGAGQGLLVEFLQRRSLQVVGVDQSLEMIRMARLRRGITLIQARGEALPASDSSFQTIIIPTGVFGLHHHDGIEQCLLECRRVLNPDGILILGVLNPDEAVLHLAQQIGHVEGYYQNWFRILRLWQAERTPAAWANLISEWTGVPWETAIVFATYYKNHLIELADYLDHFAFRLRSCGHNLKILFENIGDLSVQFFSPEDVNRLLELGRLQPLRSVRSDHGWSLVVAARLRMEGA